VTRIEAHSFCSRPAAFPIEGAPVPTTLNTVGTVAHRGRSTTEDLQQFQRRCRGVHMTEEWLGSWWTPTSEHRVGGQLRLDDDGVNLTLFGSLFDWSGYDMTKGVDFPLTEPHRLPVIHGMTIEPVSVLNVETELPMFPGADGFEGWRDDAVVGAHLSADDGAEPQFTGVQMELDTLPACARARRIAGRVWFKSGRKELIVQPHELAAARLSGGESIAIRQHALTNESPLEYTIRSPVVMTIDNLPASSWREILNTWLQPIQVLLWISTAVPARTQKLQMRLQPDGDGFRKSWAQLWVPLVEPRASTSNLNSHDVLFVVDELPGGFGRGIERWLNTWQSMRHVLGPLHARAIAPFAYADDRFYTAIAAIEGYHRYCSDTERDLVRAQHRARVRRIETIVSEQAPDLRAWAVNGLQQFNRIPLWRRIVEIANVLPNISSDLFGDKVEIFARAVESARHGHAHALEGKGDLSTGLDLYVAADALVWILRACVLIDLGFDVPECEARVRNHQRFRWTSRTLQNALAEIAPSE
jgi:hypothetical protein